MAQTKARKACNKAARACDAAWRALTEVMDFLPDDVSGQNLAKIKEMREYADYLESCRWPDTV